MRMKTTNQTSKNKMIYNLCVILCIQTGLSVLSVITESFGEG